MKGYVTNLRAPTPEYVLDAYHQLWQIEKSFRMSKSDLRARPIYHHKRESIEADPEHRGGRCRCRQTRRACHRLEHQPIREGPTALPRHHDPSRRPDRDRRPSHPDDALQPSPNSARTLRTKLAKVRVLLKRRLGLGDGRLVLGDRAPEALQCDQLRLGPTALAGVECVDRREFMGGEFEVEHVDVLGDPLRLGRLRDH